MTTTMHNELENPLSIYQAMMLHPALATPLKVYQPMVASSTSNRDGIDGGSLCNGR